MFSVFSTAPGAWWGLIALTVPVLVHLLVRRRARKVVFPSLKFVPTSQLAAFRARVVSDWPLLVLRLLIVATAVWALSGPVFVTAGRRAAWSQRIARAIVISDPNRAQSVALAADEASRSFVSAQFTAPVIADAVRDAADWLRQQPPAARELVIVGDLREGTLIARDLDVLPPLAGIRFLPAAEDTAASHVELRGAADDGTGPVAGYRVEVTASHENTVARYESDSEPLPVHVAAAAPEQARAEAVLTAVLRNGVTFGRHSDRTVTIAFPGAALADDTRLAPPSAAWMRETVAAIPEIGGGEVEGRFVALVPKSPGDDGVAQIVARVLQGAYADTLDGLEPRRIPVSRLSAWSRPYGPSPEDVLPRDEGDRRWLWAVVVGLLAVEHVLRRRPA